MMTRGSLRQQNLGVKSESSHHGRTWSAARSSPEVGRLHSPYLVCAGFVRTSGKEAGSRRDVSVPSHATSLILRPVRMIAPLSASTGAEPGVLAAGMDGACSLVSTKISRRSFGRRSGARTVLLCPCHIILGVGAGFKDKDPVAVPLSVAAEHPNAFHVLTAEVHGKSARGALLLTPHLDSINSVA